MSLRPGRLVDAKTVEHTPKNVEPLCSPRSKLRWMRESADKNKVRHSLQERVFTEVKETGSNAKRAFNWQQEQESPVAHRADCPEIEIPMPARAPIWYRHWGLNE